MKRPGQLAAQFPPADEFVDFNEPIVLSHVMIDVFEITQRGHVFFKASVRTMGFSRSATAASLDEVMERLNGETGGMLF